MASLALSTLPGGTNVITATYVGDGNYATSTSSNLNLTVTQQAPVLSAVASSQTIYYGTSPVNLTGTVAFTGTGAPPTGAVKFTIGTGSPVTATCTPSGTGNGSPLTCTASYVTSGFAASATPYTITEAISSDTNYAAVSSSGASNGALTVNARVTTTVVTSSRNPSNPGVLITFTATVTSPAPGTISGTATFYDNGTSIGTGTVTNGLATFATSTLGLGTHPITATYVPAGGSLFVGSTSAILNQVVKLAQIFVANSNGTVSLYSNTGAAIQVATSGGGVGLGVSSSGTVYSLKPPAAGASTVSTFTNANVAGTVYSYMNAAGNSASSGAQALVVDGAGTVWIAQSETEAGGTPGDIAKFSSATGTITALTGGDASIGTPSAIVVDASGSLWVTSSNNTVVEVIGAATPQETSLVQSLIHGTLATQP